MLSGTEQIIKSQNMLKCPYDPNHNTPRETFFKHLDKCKSPYKDLYVQCPFNPFHYPRKDKQFFRKHCKQCPQRLKWVQIQSTGSQEYQVLLNQEPQMLSNPLKQSFVQHFNQDNFRNSSLSQSWLQANPPNGTTPMQQFKQDDSQSIYFNKVKQLQNSRLGHQSQVWKGPQMPKSQQQSFYMSQLQQQHQQNPYAFSQYGGRVVPPPPSHYSPSQYGQPMYGNQYPQYPQYPPPMYQNSRFEPPQMKYPSTSTSSGYNNYDTEYDQQEEQNYGFRKLNVNNEEEGRQKRKKKDNKQKKDKKQKKEKKSKSSNDD